MLVIGSRRRKFINATSEVITLSIRRLRCAVCKGIHHELPDFLVPYKRHCSESIEAVIAGTEASHSVPVDESTINRWKHWFKMLEVHFASALVSIAIRHGKGTVEAASGLPKSSLRRIWP